jgi:prepilin-type N-terminal cleavage/methylation domain-containing protein
MQRSRPRHRPAEHTVSQTHGFTLLELVFAMAILSILAAVGLTAFNNAKSRAYITQMESDLRALAYAQEVYYASAGGYFTESDDPNEGKGATYTKSKKRLDFEPSPDVKIKIRANEHGWSARAEHKRRRPDRYYCAVFVGDAEAFAPAEEEGVIACEPKRKKKKKKRK